MFIPDNVLLSNPYLPFFNSPIKRTLTGNDLIYEQDSQGINSIINLTNSFGDTFLPFIDLSKWDINTKDWYLFDQYDNFPYSLTYSTSTNGWVLVPKYSISNENLSSIVVSNKDSFKYLEGGFELGVYVEGRSNGIQHKFYTGSPIALILERYVVKDISDYTGNNIKPVFSTNENFEFYYDPNLNRIFTNINLDAYNPSDIKVMFYEVNNTIQVKARLQANDGSQPSHTPYVDYYIVKLHGQHYRG